MGVSRIKTAYRHATLSSTDVILNYQLVICLRANILLHTIVLISIKRAMPLLLVVLWQIRQG